MIRICRRGHLVEGDNARPVGRTKYQQCRTCERMTTNTRRRLAKEREATISARLTKGATDAE
jgi:hypothetical protein